MGADSRLTHINLDDVRYHINEGSLVSSIGTALSENQSLESISLSNIYIKPNFNADKELSNIIDKIGKIPTLRSLNLSDNNLNGRINLVTKLLGTNKQLQHLDLSQSKNRDDYDNKSISRLSSEALQNLAKAVKEHPKLESFEFRATGHYAYDEEKLAPIRTAVLESESIRSASVGIMSNIPEMIAHERGLSLVELMKENSPELLAISPTLDVAIGDEYMVSPTNQTITLKLDSKSTRESLMPLAKLIQNNKNIGHLHISCKNLSPEFLKLILENLLQNDAIKKLTISDMEDHEHFLLIEEWLQSNKYVENLSLRSEELGDPIYAEMIANGLNESTAIRELTIDAAQLTRAMDTLIKPLIKSKTLHTLDFCGSTIARQDLETLLSENTSIREIKGINIGDDSPSEDFTLPANSAIANVTVYRSSDTLKFSDLIKLVDKNAARNKLMQVARWQVFQKRYRDQGRAHEIPSDIWNIIFRDSSQEILTAEEIASFVDKARGKAEQDILSNESERTADRSVSTPPLARSSFRMLSLDPERLVGFYTERLRATPEKNGDTSEDHARNIISTIRSTTQNDRQKMFKKQIEKLKRDSKQFPNNPKLQILLLLFNQTDFDLFLSCIKKVNELDPDHNTTIELCNELQNLDAISESEKNWILMVIKLKPTLKLAEKNDPLMQKVKEHLMDRMMPEDACTPLVNVASHLRKLALEACEEYINSPRNKYRQSSFGVKSAKKLRSDLEHASTKDVFSILHKHLERQEGRKKAGTRKHSLDTMIIQKIRNDPSNDDWNTKDHFSTDIFKHVGFGSTGMSHRDPTSDRNNFTQDDHKGNHRLLTSLTERWQEWLSLLEDAYGDENTNVLNNPLNNAGDTYSAEVRGQVLK